MKQLFGKLLILALGLSIALYSGVSEIALLVSFLLALIVCFFIEIPFAGNDTPGKVTIIISKILALIYGVASLFFPYMVFFLPMIMIDLVEYFSPLSLLPGLAVLASLLGATHYYSWKMVLIIGVFCLLSGFLGYLLKSLTQMHILIHKEEDKRSQAELDSMRRFRDFALMQDESITAATLKERNRIAREIHDNVGHMLTRSILQAGALSVINQDENLKTPIIELKETLDQAMSNIRGSVHDLHDESVNLKSSLQSIIESVSQFEVNFRYDVKGDVPKEIKYAFIAIVKESITNAEKHSNGNRMDILLREHPAFYQLSILDNGTQISVQNTGIGLENMKERVESLGGIFQIKTEHGFHINATIMKD